MGVGLSGKEVEPLSCEECEVLWLLLLLAAEVSKHARTAGFGNDTFILHQNTHAYAQCPRRMWKGPWWQ